MQNQSKTKQIHKQGNSSQGYKKKPYRPQYNNNNPHNKLTLNKFHQIQTNQNQDTKKSQSFKLHKRKRDLQRIIKHCQQKGIPIDPVKKAELDTVQSQMGDRRKHYEKDKRKEFFLDQKYKDIKMIELRKIYKHLGETKANVQMSDEEKKKEIEEWEQKLRYVKHFPKTLKYISLFPTNKPLEQKTLQFQKKIMADIEEQNSKRVTHLNFYKSQNEVSARRGARGEETNKQGQSKKASIMPLTTHEINTKKGKKTRQMVDDFFVQQEQEEESEAKQQQANQDQSEQSEIDEQMEVDDEDDVEIDEEEDDE